MTATRNHQPNPRANEETLHPKVLCREAAKVAAHMGLRVHPARIRQLVARYLASGGRCDVDRFVTYFLMHADPTGEQAVRNVTRHG